jgi:hypothetical protein
MLFKVLTFKGGSGNALKSGDRQATLRQSNSEHNALLDVTTLPEYKAVMAMPPGPQRNIAIAALNAKAQLREREYAKYWDDELPRRPITQSSSFIGDIQYDPYSELMTVNVGNKSYAYSGQSPDDVANFINSSSLEKYYNDTLK